MNSANYDTHHSFATNVFDWKQLRLDLTDTCPDFCTYSHGLVFVLPPLNLNCATMNVIDHIYIGILSRTVHITITFVTQ